MRQIAYILPLIGVIGCSESPRFDTPHIILEGDSLTEGAKKGYASAFQPPEGWTLLDHGTGGQTLAEMLSADYLRSNGEGSVIVLFAGTNDLYYNAVPGQVMHLTEKFCRKARRRSYRVVVTTLLPRDDFPYTSTLPGDPAEQSAEHDDRRTLFNKLLRHRWREFADGLIDLAADTSLGDKGDEFDQAYFDPDAVHFSQGGKTRVAEHVAESVLPLLKR